MTYLEYIKSRMPHFFNNVDVVEYVPHHLSKSIFNWFESSNYFVVDPNRTNLDNFNDNRFNVAMSLNYFQHTPDYVSQVIELHRVSSKFVLFSCAAAGHKPKRGNRYYKNLVEADFEIDFYSMFDYHRFHVDHNESQLYFWGVKKE